MKYIHSYYKPFFINLSDLDASTTLWWWLCWPIYLLLSPCHYIQDVHSKTNIHNWNILKQLQNHIHFKALKSFESTILVTCILKQCLSSSSCLNDYQHPRRQSQINHLIIGTIRTALLKDRSSSIYFEFILWPMLHYNYLSRNDISCTDLLNHDIRNDNQSRMYPKIRGKVIKSWTFISNYFFYRVLT